MEEEKRLECPFCKQTLNSIIFSDMTAIICHWCQNKIKLPTN
ncbi:MAG: hypothetical protein U9R08_01375 [Nanoarchaeota archaeon]|nr:hypothetical protein [Nanoarchaeota archaeon]